MKISRSKNRVIVLLALLACVPAWAEKSVLPSFTEVRSSHVPSEGRLLDREGNLLQELRLQWHTRVLDWVKIEDISPALQNAILEVEDRRFREHGGVDLRALAGAAWQMLAYGSKRGASTISMQTAALLETEGTKRSGRRTFWGKLRQARLAFELERTWSKEQILEAYLNLVTFRGEHQGLLAASRAIFRKDPHGLDSRESFLLATLLRAPGMNAGAAGKRLCHYAESHEELGSCLELQQFAARSLANRKGPPPRATFAPHLARRLLSLQRPELRSTLSLPLQRVAIDAIQDQLASLDAQNAQDAALIVVNNHNGEILAYVGGAGARSISPEVDMAQSRRQAGSTLKPFLYALAFDRGYLRPGSWLLDEPFEIGLDRGSYEPGNYDHRFQGPVTAQVALASSLNVPAVRMVDLIGVAPFRDLLARFGFRALEEAAHYGPSLALGTADITLFDLVQAYVALANDGIWRPLRLEPGPSEIASGPMLLSKKTTREISAILSDRGFRAATFGWNSLLATPYPSAVKTGTSKDMRDNWCVGYSRDFTVGVWVGNASGSPMWQVSGVSGAAPIWRTLMDHLHQGRAVKPFSLAEAKKSESPEFSRGNFGRILYPSAGAVLAVDPDIPENSQFISFATEGQGVLFLDDSPLSDFLWKPSKGRHHLKLSDRRGAVLDSLSFEVR